MTKSFSYKEAGVNIDAGNELVDRIKKIVKRTHRDGAIGHIGGFGGCFEIPVDRYQQPVLVSATDGVGTKLRLAIDLQQYQGIGIDLVAMCVNDLIVMGAEPLYFLDYFATAKLDLDTATTVIESIAQGCIQSNIALIGGETAEMPGMYQRDDFDLAGFTVGVVEKKQVIDGSSIEPKDILIALASSGAHSNGYSLLRHIINEKNISMSTPIAQQTLAQALLAPTKIYVAALLPLIRQKLIKGAVHITGGGFVDNIPRVLPENCSAYLNMSSWELPELFKFFQKQGNLSNLECRRTFNCGVGMIICVNQKDSHQILEALAQAGEQAWVIGHIVERQNNLPPVIFSDDQ